MDSGSIFAAKLYWKLSCRPRRLGRFILLTLIGATGGWLQPARAQGNIIDTLIQGAVSIGKSQQAASEWQQIGQPVQSCINRLLQPRNASIQGLIQHGVGPADPRLSQIRGNCEQVMSRQMQENVDCQIQLPSGATVASRCDEGWIVKQSGGKPQKISRDDAVGAMAANQQIAIMRFERTDAATRRQEADRKAAALAAEQAAKLDAQRRDDERRREAQRQEEERRKEAQRQEEERRREVLQMAEARRQQEESNRRLELARLEAERAKALQEAARIKAEADARKAADEARKEQEARDAERKRLEEEKEQNRVALLAKSAERLEESRRTCRPVTEPAGFISSLTGKSAAIKAVGNKAVPLNQAVSAILPFAVDGKEKDAKAALVARLVSQSLQWNASPQQFSSDRQDFVMTMQLLQKDCLFEALDYLGSKNADLLVTAAKAALGYEAPVPDADTATILKLVRPDALQRALSAGQISGGQVFIVEDRKQTDLERERAAALEKSRADEQQKKREAEERAKSHEEEKKRQKYSAITARFPPQKLSDCALASSATAAFVKKIDPEVYNTWHARAAVSLEAFMTLPLDVRGKTDSLWLKPLVERVALDELTVIAKPCLEDPDVIELAWERLNTSQK